MSFKVALSFHLNQYYDYMRDHGYEVDKVEMVRNDEAESIEKLKGYDAIIGMNEMYTAPVLDALKDDLKIICRHGIGYDKVDINHAAKLGICCCNTPGTMSTGVAETALMLMLECSRKLYPRHAELKQGVWNRGEATQELAGKTVGFLGFGNIAQKLAQYLSGFECKLLAYDVYYNEEAMAKYNVEKATKEEIARVSDFVSVHVPHMESTTKYINAEFLSMMKPTAYLINTARGKVVDEEALIEALKNKTIAGAGLDVYWTEPVSPDNELLKMDNVFCTPHIATNTEQCTTAGFDGVIRVFDEFRAGKVPYSCLNPSYVDNVNKREG